MCQQTVVLKEFFEAINRNDMKGVTDHFDRDIVRVEPPGFPTSGTYRGIEEVRAHIIRGRGTWAEGTCDPEKFLENGDKVVVYLHARVRLKDATEWIDGKFADGFVLRDCRIIHYQTFAERREALVWAGMDDQQS